MKKLLALVLAGTMLLSFAGCGKKNQEPETTVAPTITETTTVPTTEPTTVPTTEATTVPTTEAATVPETTALPTEPDLVLPEGFTMVDETVYATRNVNIRTEPTVNSHSPGQLLRGESVLRIGVSGDGWSAVLYKDEVCYIASKYLTTQQPQNGGNGGGTPVKVTESASSGTVYTNHYVNIRKGPGADTPKLGQIPEGATVTRLAVCSNGWVKVSYNGIVGYVAGGYLTDKAPVPDTPKPTQPVIPDPSERPVAPSTPAGGGGSKDPSAPGKDPTDPKVPDETRKPDETKVPDETKKPDETKAPDETTKPVETTKPEEPKAPDPSRPKK